MSKHYYRDCTSPKLSCADCTTALVETSTITFEDRDGATGAAVAAALDRQIRENTRAVRLCLDIVERIGDVQPCEDDDCYECTREVLDRTDAELDAVGYAIDSIRLARVLQALDSL
jgi:hypothetical protein